MTRLTEIGKKYNTDKATYHLYTELYEAYFKEFTNPSILEIGIYQGASIHMYQEFWNLQCTIMGIDRGDQMFFQNSYPNVKIVSADQGVRKQLESAAHGCGFDIIVDDGSHMVSDQLISIATLFPYLKSGGIYIIEDLHTSMPEVAHHYNKDGVTNTITFLEDLKMGISSSNSGLSDDEFDYLLSNVASVELLYPRGPLTTAAESSMTSVIRKQ
jgi:hypothetical protein